MINITPELMQEANDNLSDMLGRIKNDQAEENIRRIINEYE